VPAAYAVSRAHDDPMHGDAIRDDGVFGALSAELYGPKWRIGFLFVGRCRQGRNVCQSLREKSSMVVFLEKAI
jgi:hypothetical protein